MKRKVDRTGLETGSDNVLLPQKWTELHNTVPDLIVVLDKQHHILWVNQTLADRLGMSPADCVGRTCYSLLHHTDRPPDFCPANKFEADEKTLISSINAPPFGKQSVVTTLPFHDAAGIRLGTVHVARDRSAADSIGSEEIASRIDSACLVAKHSSAENRNNARRVNARPSYSELETALHECEEKYRTAFEHSLIGLYRTTPEGRILLVNQALQDMLGYTSFGELAERDLETSGYEPAYSRTRFKDEIERRGRVVGWESAWLRKDGSILHVRESARAIRDEKGETRYYEGTVEDITDRKRAEERLQLLSSIVEQSTEGIALVGLDDKLMFVNHAFGKMHGYDSNELLGKKISRLYSADQREIAKTAKRQVIDAGNFRGEMRHTRKDKSTFPAAVNNSLLRDRRGKAIGMIMVMRDMTDRKQAEEALQSAHERLSATINALPDILLEVDGQGRIFDFRAPDPGRLRLDPKGVPGTNLDDWLPGQAATVIKASIRKAARAGQDSGATYSMEVDGQSRWYELSVAAKGGRKSRNRRFIALVRDVTERKNTENQLRQATEELRGERESLSEKNIALKQILEHIESQKKAFRRSLSRELRQTIRSHLRRLRAKTDLVPAECEDLEAIIDSILSRDSDDFEGRLASLSPREKQICEMIASGLSSKQISEQLVVSTATIHKHREQIRRKLGITNKGLNLSSFLQSRGVSGNTQ